MTLEEALAEFNRSNYAVCHVGIAEAMSLLLEIAGQAPRFHEEQGLADPRQQEMGRFLDWLLYEKKDRHLAYELLQRVGRSISVAGRDYWISDQRDRRAIAWESTCCYPGTDSNVWNIIYVDDE